MANIVINEEFVNLTIAEGLSGMASSYSWWMVLTQTGCPAPDETHVYSDISSYICDYKGYVEQELTPGWGGGGPPRYSQLDFGTAAFPYDSGSGGSSSNTVVGFALVRDLDTTPVLMLEGELDTPFAVSADGHEPRIPLKIQITQQVPCP